MLNMLFNQKRRKVSWAAVMGGQTKTTRSALLYQTIEGKREKKLFSLFIF